MPELTCPPLLSLRCNTAQEAAEAELQKFSVAHNMSQHRNTQRVRLFRQQHETASMLQMHTSTAHYQRSVP